MTQPNEAVGAVSDTVVAAEPTITDRFAALGEDQDKRPEEEDVSEEAIAAEAEAGLESEGVTGEEEAEEAEQAAALIPPPVSWTAEEKEEFSKLPPKLQETLTRREAEREKFVQSKAQEAKQTRSAVEQEALQILQQVRSTQVQALETFLVQVPAKPSHQMQVDDPYLYADQMDAHDRAAAHNAYVEQQIGAVEQHLHQINAQQAQAMQAASQSKVAELRAVLSERFPEFLDPTTGPKLQQELGSIASTLGYRIEQADASDILAMREVSGWKAKADKYDTLMAKQMDKVRAAKNLPRVTRPGAAQGRGAAEGQRYATDRQAMQQGDKDATARVFGRFLTS